MKLKQMNIDSAAIVEVKLTGVAVALKPTVFKDGDSYCCLLGEDPQTGVFGCGDTPEKALNNWDNNLKLHLVNARPDDEIVKLVRYIIDLSPKKIPPHVQEFYDQFRPVDKTKIRRK